MDNQYISTIPLAEEGHTRVECIACHKPMCIPPHPVNFIICKECVNVLAEMIRDYKQRREDATL